MMTQLKIALALPSNGASPRAKKALRLKGVVVRKEKHPATGRYLIAVFFSDIGPADLKTLESFIQHRLQA